jgi:tetratricopeptide (TPR) repeat protein
MVELGERSGEREVVLWGRVWRVIDLLELGRRGETEAEIAAFGALARELRLPSYLWWPALWGAMLALLDGRFEDCERLAQEALAVGTAAHDQAAVAHFGMQTLWLRRNQGRLHELRAPLEAWVAQYPAVHAWRCALANLYAEVGLVEEARVEFERLAQRDFAAIPRDYNWVVTLSLLAETCALLGDVRRAKTLYRLLEPFADHCVLAGYATVCGGAVSRYLGRLAETAHELERAEAHYEHAMALNSQLGAVPLLAKTRSDYAEMLNSRGGPGDEERARELAAKSVQSALSASTQPRLGEN